MCYRLIEKKKLPVRTYFLMLCCLVFLVLAIETAAAFLAGGPVFTGANADFE
jgi:hypothetical protein